MAREFNPPPIQQPFLVNGRMSEAWLRWFHQVREHFRADDAIAWDSVDNTGSDLADLATRRHRDLQDLQGGTTDEYYHLTSAQHTETTGFFTATDISGAEAETLTDGSNADSLHAHAHNALSGLQGGTTAEYYHLTSSHHTTLTGGGDADALHTHPGSGQEIVQKILLTPADDLVTDGLGHILIGSA